jgi:hypothetical protein
MEDDRVGILEAQLAQAKLIAEEADKKYEEVAHLNMIVFHVYENRDMVRKIFVEYLHLVDLHLLYFTLLLFWGALIYRRIIKLI